MTDHIKTDRLYYDGACPLCCSEIDQLRRLSGGKLVFVDVHSLPDNSPDKIARLERLHLELGAGEVLSGLDANVAAWQNTPVGFLFRPLRWPLIRALADKVYDAWASRRFRRLYGSSRKV